MTEDMQGWATLADGSRVALTPEACRDILKRADEQQAARAALMPDEQSAIRAMSEAFTRLRELGWRDACYCPKDGAPFLAVEVGSTGIHQCVYLGEWPGGGWWTYDGEWPMSPCLFKLATPPEGGRDG